MGEFDALGLPAAAADESRTAKLGRLPSRTPEALMSFFSQLPAELQGLALVPYSPGFDTMESQKSRRHISLV